MEDRNNLRGPLWAMIVVLAIGTAALTAAVLMRTPRAVKFSTPYQTVLLGNGNVFYGQLQGYGTEHPVLTNVFYIVTQQNPETKQPTNVLVRRGKELHAPDRMYLNPRQIVLVEPVGPESRVAKLISEAK